MKSPAITDLVAVVREYNQAHELHLRYPPEVRANKNPMLENLYHAAALASEKLKLALSAEVKIKHKHG